MPNETCQPVTELSDEHFNRPVYDTLNGVLNVLYRDEDKNEVVFMSLDGKTELDRIEAEEFEPGLIRPIPEEVVADPASYVEQVIDDTTTQPMGIGQFMEDICLKYAEQQVEIVNKEDN